MTQLARFSVRYSGPIVTILDISQRAWNKLARESWQEVGHWWHETIRPKHFTAEGKAEYQYAPRSGERSGSGGKAFWRSYTGRKLRSKGHTLPLVFTGELRARSAVARIQTFATSSGAGVRIFLPQAQKANFRNKHSSIDMRDELTRVSLREADEAARRYDEAMERRLRAIQESQTKEIR